MKPIVIFPDITVYLGDCVDSMKTMPDQSVQTCITSPPYFGLRDYGVDGQIGLEQSPEAYVAKLVEVFREVKRVLMDDGTLWLNLGDSYAGSGKGQYLDGENDPKKKKTKGMKLNNGNVPLGLKPKDLMGIPWRVAFALQADGWYLRQDIIWHKPNPMPESVTDRCTKSHEYIFLLSKSNKYYFDNEAIKEHANPDSTVRDRDNTRLNNTPGRTKMAGLKVNDYETRNKRSVWTVTTNPTSIAHFATFPPDLIEPCVLAGCPVSGTVLDPFGGSGTTGGVAMKHGRKAVLCELNPEYVGIMEQRVVEVVNERNVEEVCKEQIDLFGEVI